MWSFKNVECVEVAATLLSELVLHVSFHRCDSIGPRQRAAVPRLLTMILISSEKHLLVFFHGAWWVRIWIIIQYNNIFVIIHLLVETFLDFGCCSSLDFSQQTLHSRQKRPTTNQETLETVWPIVKFCHSLTHPRLCRAGPAAVVQPKMWNMIPTQSGCKCHTLQHMVGC